MTSGLVFLGLDRPELNAVAGADREIPLVAVDDAQGRPAEQVPAAGRLDRIDPRLPAGDGHRTGRHAEPRRLAARQPGQGRRQIAGIRKARLRRRRTRLRCASRSPRRGPGSAAMPRHRGPPRRTGPGSPAASPRRRGRMARPGRSRGRGGGIPAPAGRPDPGRRRRRPCHRRGPRRSRPAIADRAPPRPSRRRPGRRRIGPGRRGHPGARSRSAAWAFETPSVIIHQDA
jgi:hypothetical protein